MSEFQSFINRLYTDQAFRKLNELSSDEAQKFYSLTENDVSLLKTIELNSIDNFAQSIKLKSRERHLKTFPLSVSLIGEKKIYKYFERFYDLARPYPGETKLALVGKFGQFLEDSTLADPDVHKAAPELIRFERKLVELGLIVSPEDNFDNINKAQYLQFDAAILKSVKLSENTYTDKYDYDIPEIVELLKQGQEVETILPKATYVAFIVLPNEARPKVLKLNKASMSLLDLAKTEISVEELAIELGDITGKKVAEKDVLEALSFFSKNLLIKFKNKVG